MRSLLHAVLLPVAMASVAAAGCTGGHDDDDDGATFPALRIDPTAITVAVAQSANVAAFVQLTSGDAEVPIETLQPEYGTGCGSTNIFVADAYSCGVIGVAAGTAMLVVSLIGPDSPDVLAEVSAPVTVTP